MASLRKKVVWFKGYPLLQGTAQYIVQRVCICKLYHKFQTEIYPNSSQDRRRREFHEAKHSRRCQLDGSSFNHRRKVDAGST